MPAMAVLHVGAESVQREREEWKRREFGPGCAHVQIHREVRRVETCGGCEPSTSFTKVKPAQQVRAGRGPENDHHARQVHRGDEVEPYQMPELREVIKHRWVKKE